MKRRLSEQVVLVFGHLIGKCPSDLRLRLTVQNGAVDLVVLANDHLELLNGRTETDLVRWFLKNRKLKNAFESL